ncbi:hypothetical protein GALMADRAFT_253646 [Galerina marginata CBS 339.88]|uniref:GED domain-containing protein n=1 Tax=Galerina marginata (strain CBS 339.88) TaxID=685588 RepID=A0A067SVZ3_GALM3|nr:hypothetical protein GALMADRAFT_253646 [Galerina marginata CBS 339.88]
MVFSLRRNRSVSTSNGTSARQRTISTPSLPVLPESNNQETSSLSTSDYALKCRQIMELYWALRDLHVTTIFDLPRVVVIGSQSSGKSSLVEAVSGINVPRDSGTCTRCPMDCTMSSNTNSWSCTIELRRDFGTDGNRLTNPTIETFGQVIENRSLVELQIRRAQAAILSPHRPASDFYGLSKAELGANAKNDQNILQFSKNVVQVNVKDPNATDLTFVDLPGLIHNAEKDLINIVHDLAEDYIRAKNTLIVIAMPMTDDIQNIQAVTLAKDRLADPGRERTIGVLTKPDTLKQGALGSRESWKSILQGHEAEHNTKHGYYCVRLLDDGERAQTKGRADAEKLAADYFNSTPPWSEMADKSRLGIPNFVKDISRLLIELIEKNIPELKKAVDKELVKCIDDIRKLPPVLNMEPSTAISLRISNFCQAIKDSVSGVKHKQFVQANKDRYLRFKDDIENTTPDFRPFEDVGVTSELEHRNFGRPRNLPEVRNVIKGCITWELPGHIPFEATATLVLQYTSLWEEPSKRCFQDVVENGRQFLGKLLEDHFGRYKELERYMRALTFKERDIHQEETHLVLDKLLRLESKPLFTQNFETLLAEETKWLAAYRSDWAAITRGSIRDYGHSYPVTTESSVFHEFPRRTFPHILDESPSASTIDDELKVMANVQAYFQVAHKRIIDEVPLAIEHELHQSFANAIHTTLFDAVAKDSESGQVDLRELICEDPADLGRRQELEDRKARLLQIKLKLDTFRPGRT